MVFLEPHRSVLNEKSLDVGGIMVGAPTEPCISCTEVNSSTRGWIACVSAMVVVAIKLPQIVSGIHVVVNHIEKYCQSSRVTCIDQPPQVVRFAIEHFRRVEI